MAPQCISRRCWCSPWPLLEHRRKWAVTNQLFTGTTTLVSLPTMEDPFLRSRRGYCCTNASVERSLMLEGLAGQAAGAGPRTGSCCCSCKSAISVGEARWSGPLQLTQCLPTALLHCPQCLQTALLHCSVPPDSSSTLPSVPPDSSSTLPSLSASRQLLYTALSASRQLFYTALSASRQLFYTALSASRQLSTSNPDRSAKFVGEWCGELRESRLEAWIKSHKSEVAIT